MVQDRTGALGGLFAPAWIYGDEGQMAAVADWNARNLRRPPALDPWFRRDADPASAQRDAIATWIVRSGDVGQRYGGSGADGADGGIGDAGALGGPATGLGPGPTNSNVGVEGDPGAPGPSSAHNSNVSVDPGTPPSQHNSSVAVDVAPTPAPNPDFGFIGPTLANPVVGPEVNVETDPNLSDPENANAPLGVIGPHEGYSVVPGPTNQAPNPNKTFTITPFNAPPAPPTAPVAPAPPGTPGTPGTPAAPAADGRLGFTQSDVSQALGWAIANGLGKTNMATPGVSQSVEQGLSFGPGPASGPVTQQGPNLGPPAAPAGRGLAPSPMGFNANDTGPADSGFGMGMSGPSGGFGFGLGAQSVSEGLGLGLSAPSTSDGGIGAGGDGGGGGGGGGDGGGSAGGGGGGSAGGGGGGGSAGGGGGGGGASGVGGGGDGGPGGTGGATGGPAGGDGGPSGGSTGDSGLGGSATGGNAGDAGGGQGGGTAGGQGGDGGTGDAGSAGSPGGGPGGSGGDW